MAVDDEHFVAKVILGREELYKQVWNEPVRRIAARLGISDVALAKACRKMKIPLPERGHWAKVAVGKKVVRPKLPPSREGEPAEYRVPHSASVQLRLSPVVAGVLDQELAPENRIEVPGQLVDPHPLVAEAQSLLGKAKPNKEGILQRVDRRCLDLCVSPALLERSLRIMDALLKALETRGYSLENTPPQKVEKKYSYGPSDWLDRPARTFVTIGRHQIAFGLYEETEYTHPPAQRPSSDAPYEMYRKWQQAPIPPRKPTGVLMLTMKDVSDVGRKSWSDGKPKQLEDILNMFVRALVRASEVLERKRLELEERQKRWKTEQEERQRQEEARREEAERVDRLDKQLSGWRKASDVREFVKEARALITQGGEQATPDTDEYLRWALTRADALDPLATLRARTTGRIEDPPEMDED